MVIGAINDSGIINMDNVTVKNSSVIGHRDVGALVGGMQSAEATLTLKNNIVLDNVKVKTTGGRSGLLVGKVFNTSKIDVDSAVNISTNNSAISIYNDKNLEQKFAAGNDVPTEWNPAPARGEIYRIEGQDQFIYSYKGLKNGVKEYCAYGYKADALVLIDVKGAAWKAITDLTEFKKGLNVA